jgi:DNA polymerase-1
MTTALIDGDIVAYMAAVLAQEDAFPPLPGQTEEDCKPTADLKKAKRIAREIMDKWTHVAGCTDRRVAMSDRTTSRASFRYQVHPHYKNQRVNERPLLLEQVEKYLYDRHDAVFLPHLEGDDLLSMWQTDDTVVISKDKDMLTIPGRVLIIPHMKTTDGLKPQKITKRAAANNLFMQVLTGDAIDNYSGAPGVGKAKAAEFLNDIFYEPGGQRWPTIVKAFTWAWENRPRYHGLWVHPENPEEEALMNMRCARLLKDADYIEVDGNGNKHNVGLWLPGGEREWI